MKVHIILLSDPSQYGVSQLQLAKEITMIEIDKIVVAGFELLTLSLSGILHNNIRHLIKKKIRFLITAQSIGKWKS